ncbi:MAG: hypothetical protein LBT27_07860 [Prevotellaceae bacterium]|jgi:hypothetical protein|nr:hypothetical protein [Prevotellaceae bacterium]
MKKVILNIIVMVFSFNIYGQMHCGSELNLTELQNTNPIRYQIIMDLENQTQSRLMMSINSIPQGTIIIPVVVHVVYQNNSQNISDAQINSQLQVLNEDFRRLNTDKINTPTAFAGIAGNANIEFKLAKIAPNGTPTSGITRTQTSKSGFSETIEDMKYTSTGGHDAWNTQMYLNIWVCNFSSSSLGGYAQFPDELQTKPNTDGVVVSYKYFGRDGTAVSPHNKGRIATHEVGHWLNLRHIWGDAANCSATDFVDDTPNQYTATSECPSFPQTDNCTTTSPGVMFMNYMDYTNDACMNIFTNGQVARMRSLFDTQTGIRKQMLVTAGFITNPPTMSGSSPICGASTYTLSNVPTGATVTWQTNPSTIAGVVGNGNSAVVTPLARGTFTLTANINGYAVSKSISAGVSNVPYAIMVRDQTPYSNWNNSYQVNYGSSYYFELYPPDVTINRYEWTFGNNLNNLYYWSNYSYPFTVGGSGLPAHDSMVIGFVSNPKPGLIDDNPISSITVISRFRDCMGWSPDYVMQLLTVNNSTYSAAYSNPASDELYIDKIEETNTESATNNIQQTATTKTKQSEITILLYSNSTTKLVYSKNYPSSAKQIKIDTSKLPNGVYYLNIIENGETIKQQTIIVNH